MLNIYHNLLTYENKEINRESESIVLIFIISIIIQKLNSQIITENNYLRQICERVIGETNINKEVTKRDGEKIENEENKVKKQKNFHRRTDTKVSLIINTDNSENSENSMTKTVENNNLDNALSNSEITIVEVNNLLILG